MKTYRDVWTYVAGVLMVLGGLIGLVVIPLDVLVFSFAVTVLLVVASVWAWTEDRGWGSAVRIGVGTACALVSAAAYIRLGGIAGVVLVVLAGVTAPPVLRWIGRREHGELGKSGDHGDHGSGGRGRVSTRAGGGEVDAALTWSAEQSLAREEWMGGSPTDMGSAVLCAAWRTSYLALHQPLSATSKAGIVQRRRELLDELERRNPAGFTAWLASGARAAEDPRRYIVTQRGDESHL